MVNYKVRDFHKLINTLANFTMHTKLGFRSLTVPVRFFKILFITLFFYFYGYIYRDHTFIYDPCKFIILFFNQHFIRGNPFNTVNIFLCQVFSALYRSISQNHVYSFLLLQICPKVHIYDRIERLQLCSMPPHYFCVYSDNLNQQLMYVRNNVFS